MWELVAEGQPYLFWYKGTAGCLGSGSFGTVDCGYDFQQKKWVAIKRLKRGVKITHDPRTQSFVRTEIINHSQLVHPHIIFLYKVILTPEDLCIVMELGNGRTLLDVVRAHKVLDEDYARWFFQQLIAAVDFCHEKGICNRDVKLENLVLHYNSGSKDERPLLKLADFGYSKRSIFHSSPNLRVGTFEYMAPEVISCTTPQQRFDGRAVDIWSCGVVLYLMLFGAFPFGDRGDGGPAAMKRLMKNITSANFVIPPNKISPGCEELLRGILRVDTRQRWTAQSIFGHPWFTKGLPEGYWQMNKLQPRSYGFQSEEEIAALVKMAAVPAGGAEAPAPVAAKACRMEGRINGAVAGSMAV